MKKIAILVCLAMLISLFAVGASAAEVTITSTVDFRTLTPAEAGDASKAAMEALGITVPAESGAWWLQDCFHVFATPKDGYADCFYIQKLEAPEGKTLTADATLTAGYWLAAMGDPSYFVVEVSTDGENWTEAYADEAGRGVEWEASAYAEGTITLPGTKGASVVYVKILVNRHGGQTAGGVSYSIINGTVEGEAEPAPELPANAVVNEVRFANTDKIPAGSGGTLSGADAKAELEAMGLVIPEDSNAWMLNDCFHIFATPQEGYQTCSYIQKLEAGEGKVFEENVSLSAGYWLAAVGDPSWFWIEVSTDGENWTEAYVDEAGRGTEWDASAYVEGTIPLEGTAGASVVYIKVCVERHSGPTAGGVSFTTLQGATKAAEGGNDQPTPPDETGDMIGVVIALLAVSGMGITVLKKRN